VEKLFVQFINRKHMSRIGKQLIKIPSGVTATINGSVVEVKGPKGNLKRDFGLIPTIKLEDGIITVSVKNPEEKKERSMWGTTTSHIKNMIEGVSQGFKKELEVSGVGYKVAMQGADLKLEVGFSHSVIYKIPAGITASVDTKANKIAVEGSDKELLGKTAAEIRNIKKPEPYKGKGIKYSTETIRRKAGKTASK
jgi:large subunit ribosomal protein L6